jgi:hypothetical protein
MNLYFLSLLEADKEREKNVALKYKISTTDSGVKNVILSQIYDYLNSRFPFVRKGDEIDVGATSFYWGSKIGGCLEPNIVHPLFYLGMGIDHCPFSKSDLEKIRNSKLEKRTRKFVWVYDNSDVLLGFFVCDLKIRKVRYKLFLFSYEYVLPDDNSFSVLENQIRNGNDCLVNNDDLVDEEDGLLYRRKKIVHVHFW